MVVSIYGDALYFVVAHLISMVFLKIPKCSSVLHFECVYVCLPFPACVEEVWQVPCCTMCVVCTYNLCLCLEHTLPTEVECSWTSSRKFPSRLQSAMTDYRFGIDFSANLITCQLCRFRHRWGTESTGFMKHGSFSVLIIWDRVCNSTCTSI